MTLLLDNDDLGSGRHYLFKSMDGALPRLGVHALRVSSDLTHEHDGRREKIPAAPGERYVGLVVLFDQAVLVPLAVPHDGYLQRMHVGAGEVVERDAAKTVTRAEVVAGRAGRTSPEQIRLFTGGSTGLGKQFAAVAHAVFTAARDAGVGRELPTEWFTQKEKP